MLRLLIKYICCKNAALIASAVQESGRMSLHDKQKNKSFKNKKGDIK